jgi:hypothetical protein
MQKSFLVSNHNILGNPLIYIEPELRYLSYNNPNFLYIDSNGSNM